MVELERRQQNYLKGKLNEVRANAPELTDKDIADAKIREARDKQQVRNIIEKIDGDIENER